jgi:hypothetical protein
MFCLFPFSARCSCTSPDARVLALPAVLNPLVVLNLLAAISLQLLPACGADGKSLRSSLNSGSAKVPFSYAGPTTDFRAENLSEDALQLAGQLQLLEKFRRLEELRQSELAATGSPASVERRLEILELKEDISETLDATRMEIEYVRSALAAELAVQSELVRAYTQRRDNRVLQSNLWSFRTNGALWAVTEALSIPTYSHPRYSVSAGTLGIMAGLLPTAFSLVALRTSQGGSFDRQRRPNMLARVFDYPFNPAIDYPESVWNFLNSPPAHRKGEGSRIKLLIDQWLADRNIHILSSLNNKAELDLLTGSAEQHLSISLLSDRVAMMSQLDALVSLMNRPLLELLLFVRGVKHLPAAASG